jgi:hypothetical protein
VPRRVAAAVASLNRWRGMLRRAKRRRSSGNVSKSASMKISTVSSLGTNLDTNRRVAEIDLVSSSVRSSNDGVGHYRLAFRVGGDIRPPLTGQDPKKQSNYGLERCGPLDQRS